MRKNGPERVVAGGDRQSIVQAEWAGPRTLVYVNDPDGWWNLYRLELTPEAGRTGLPLCPREEEFGGAMWQLGLRWIVPLADGTIAAIGGRGASRLSILARRRAAIRRLAVHRVGALPGSVGTEVAGVAASPQRPLRDRPGRRRQPRDPRAA